MRAPILLATATAGVALLLAACGGDDSDTATPASEPAQPTESTPTPEPPAAAQVDPLPVDQPGARETVTLSIAGNDLQLTVVLPDDFVAGETRPILLALPPGGQGQPEVDFGLDTYWAAEARRRGWIVVSPVAPEGALFFQGSEALVPELLDTVAATYPPEDGRFHVAGISNGGLSSFRVAVEFPERFASVITLPGFAPTAGDLAKFDGIVGIPVRMFVGETDTSWVEGGEQARDALEELGGDVELTIAPDEGHIIRSLTGAELFDLLDAARS
ncbi:MAG: alpha/beta hydrolase-fold protein [Gaiellaceae bacterium]